jgi:tetratricopeptide (TPR) repeat protein
LGLLAYTAGDYARALPMLEECLTQTARLPNGKQIAWAHYNLGKVLLDCGDLAQAADHFAESSRLWRERNEVLAVAYCQSGEANCLLRQGDFAQAVILYESTLVIYRQFEAQRAVAWTLWDLAQVAASKGDSDRSKGLLHESLAIFQRRNEAAGIACCVAALRGEWAPVREPLRQ